MNSFTHFHDGEPCDACEAERKFWLQGRTPAAERMAELDREIAELQDEDRTRRRALELTPAWR
jgi:hypothetical protein